MRLRQLIRIHPHFIRIVEDMYTIKCSDLRLVDLQPSFVREVMHDAPVLGPIDGVALADVHSFGTETSERYEVEVRDAVHPPEPRDAGGVRVDAVYEVHSAEERRPETLDRKSTRLNSSHSGESRMPSSA